MPADFVPPWAKQAVWYQIFPERFWNGDPRHNPRLEDQRGAWPHDLTAPWQIHPWTSDWYALQPWEQQNQKGLWFNLLRRRYGGDLQGILDRLDYLRDLGVNALYLNPVFAAPSAHKYDGATYHHIDPTFGPDPDGDRRQMAAEQPADPATWVWTAADRQMLSLIQAVHRRGMRLIFDGVFNHVGINHWAFQDVAQRQQTSPYRDWFKVKAWDNPAAGTHFDYEGWWGVKELPEWKQDARGLVAGPKQYVFDCTRRWMDPDGDGDPGDGIDGWRLDVAFCVRHGFWKDWRQHVKAINPEAYLTAEIIEPPENNIPYLQGDEFDAVMNYNFAFACAEFFIEEKHRIGPAEFDHRLRTLREAYPPGVAYGMQNLFSSHDTNRLGSHIVNRRLGHYRDYSQYYGLSKADNPAYDPRRPTAEALKIQKLLVLFQMTYVGAPMIYYGDEAGLWGANDPCCRKPMLWPDLAYADEATNPDGQPRARPDPVVFDHDLFRHYQALIRLRRQTPALQLGDYRPLLMDEARHLYAFERSLAGQRIVVILNNQPEAQPVTLTLAGSPAWVDVLDGQRPCAAAPGGLTLEMAGYGGRLLQSC